MNGHTGPAESGVSEIWTFAATVFFVFPAMAVTFVGAFGLIVWIIQMMFGPPAAPG